MRKLIYLAKRYDLVVGDRFELFYRGVIKTLNPARYNIYINCVKGKAYPRYYTYTPNESDVGDYELTLTLYDDYHDEIESAKTTLHIVKLDKISKDVNILCFGDSLTCNGVWPYVGYERICKTEAIPSALGLGEKLHFFGTCKKDEVGFEGYGGWKWKEFCDNEAVGIASSVWITCEHNFDENDQHSVWKNNDKLWILETIEKGSIKFKRGPGNIGCSRNIGEMFEHVEGGYHTDSIKVLDFKYEESNPFFDEKVNGPSFLSYCEKHNYPHFDFIYILLSWNGQWIPFREGLGDHEKYIYTILDTIHKELPNCKVGLIGIQSPAITGGITANYNCSGPYHDLLGELTTAYNFNLALEELSLSDKYKDYVRYIDMKAQFDVEYNTPQTPVKVNNRNDVTELIGTNGVHPTMNGYLQIGDCFYRALVSDLKDKEDR